MISNTDLKGTQKVIFDSTVKFYMDLGYSQDHSIALGLDKLKRVNNLRNRRDIIKK